MDKALGEALAGVVVTTVIYLGIVLVRRTLDPPFGRLAFASTKSHADRVLAAWKERKTKGRTFLIVAVENLLLIPLYVTTTWMLGTALDDLSRPVLSKVNTGAMITMVVAALAHFAQNLCILVTLLLQARKLMVFLTSAFGWIKNTSLALSVVYIIFRIELYLSTQLKAQETPYTLASLIVSTLVVALLMARRQTALSRAHPPLLALQLAPSRFAAKDVFERWGEKGRKDAHSALLLQSLFAVLYGLTLAVICDRVDVAQPELQMVRGYVGWIMLIAATCHVAQNLGAYAALRLRSMGWWGAPMRRLGWVRIGLLVLGTAYFVILLIRREWQWAQSLADSITG